MGIVFWSFLGCFQGFFRSIFISFFHVSRETLLNKKIAFEIKIIQLNRKLSFSKNKLSISFFFCGILLFWLASELPDVISATAVTYSVWNTPNSLEMFPLTFTHHSRHVRVNHLKLLPIETFLHFFYPFFSLFFLFFNETYLKYL